jgi:hemoglobin/transferrin/lactoferrin receptor protein
MNYRAFLVSLSVVFLFSADLLLGQTLKVVDKTTLEPIPNVYIYNNERNKMASTDAEGEANISKFTQADTLNFQHPAYQPLSLSYQQVEERGNQVRLAEKSVVLEEVYISASKRPQDITEIPQRISQISEEPMLPNNHQTPVDPLHCPFEASAQKR